MDRSTAFRLVDEAMARRDPTGRWARRIMILAIIANAIATVTSTVKDIGPEFVALFRAVEVLALILFALDYGVRVWVAPERRPADQSAKARWDYIFSGWGIIDFLAVLPPFLGDLVAADPGYRALMGIVATVKLLRYFSAVETIIKVIRMEARAITAALAVMFVLLVLAATVMYLLERDAQPENFASVPHAMWWGIVTLATVGYGDLVPVTAAGRLLGGMATILGLGMFALPAGILATGFAEELKKRDFVVTWGLVARVPLFQKLPAAEIAEVAELLRLQQVPERYAVVRKGEAADAMYFLLDGEVEVELDTLRIKLKPGDFFGEIALVLGGTRTATVATTVHCELLVLAADDFKQLAKDKPLIGDEIARVARARMAELKAMGSAVEGGGIERNRPGQPEVRRTPKSRSSNCPVIIPALDETVAEFHDRPREWRAGEYRRDRGGARPSRKRHASVTVSSRKRHQSVTIPSPKRHGSVTEPPRFLGPRLQDRPPSP